VRRVPCIFNPGTQLRHHFIDLTVFPFRGANDGFTAGQQLGWHFDRSDFSVTLSLQAASAGGDFEYIRMLSRC